MNTLDKIKSDLARLCLEIGSFLHKSGQIDRAADFFRRSIEFNPTPQAHTCLGSLYSVKGLYDKAFTECLEAIKLDPKFSEAYNDIGAYLMQLKRFDLAIPWLQKALDSPESQIHGMPYVNMGYIFEIAGHWDLAAHYYRMALAVNPHEEKAKSYLDKLIGKYN